MTDEVFEILRAAITHARNESINTVAKLRERLLRAYPGKSTQIDEALHAWASQERRTY